MKEKFITFNRHNDAISTNLNCENINWGYIGDAPANFAYNILCNFVPEIIARKLHKFFMLYFISGAPQCGKIPVRTIKNWIYDYAPEISR